MYISKIHLENFRNYETFDINMSDGVTVLHGKNGLGKTNILEAVFLSVIGKSFRNCKDVDLIRYDQKKYFVEINILDDITENISIKYEKNREKYIKVNGFYLRKLGHLMGNVLAVIFSPEDLQLITEGPAVRRKFMDIAISQLNPSYYFDLLQYNKILLQKNSLLKKMKYVFSEKDSTLMEVLNDQLSEVGSKIICKRVNFLQELSEIAGEKNRTLSEKEILDLKYESGAFFGENSDKVDFLSEKDVKENLFKIMSEKLSREIERETSCIGPHRDDIIVRLDNNDIKKFGSQGQKRTAVLSLKMAELEILKKKTGRKPLFLLDDVLSELDINRQIALIDSINGIQTIITCTHIDNIIEKQTSFNAISLENLIEKNTLK